MAIWLGASGCSSKAGLGPPEAGIAAKEAGTGMATSASGTRVVLSARELSLINAKRKVMAAARSPFRSGGRR